MTSLFEHTVDCCELLEHAIISNIKPITMLRTHQAYKIIA
jgi:hypothetical protein